MIKDHNGEDEKFLTEQVITYIGNKRALLDFIGPAVCEARDSLGKDRIDIADIFSGSGIVSRYLKQYSRKLYVNDLENYCETINRCYLANAESVDKDELIRHYRHITGILEKEPFRKGFISRLYSPEDDENIQPGERVFFTSRNAAYIDTARGLIEEMAEPYRTYLLAPLLYEASVHNNTGGVFKGFYKNSKTGTGQFGGNGRYALSRITSDISLKLPVWSRYACDVSVYKEDAGILCKKLPHTDLVYIDPPYNQHPYGSNYFMLNLINDYVEPVDISRVSGIPKGWNRSDYNRADLAKECLARLCGNLDTDHLLISFSDDGFISREEMTDMLEGIGKVKVMSRKYNTFRASRNLQGRNIHVKELLYLVRKK